MDNCDACTNACNADSNCFGYSKKSQANECYLKTSGVLGSSESANGFTFYRKPGATSTSRVSTFFAKAKRGWWGRRRSLLEAGDVSGTLARAVSAALTEHFGTVPIVDSVEEADGGGATVETTVVAVTATSGEKESFAEKIAELIESPGEVVSQALVDTPEFADVASDLETAEAAVTATSDKELADLLTDLGISVPEPEDDVEEGEAPALTVAVAAAMVAAASACVW